MRLLITLILILCFAISAAQAAGQTADQFLEEIFQGTPPPPETLWLTGATKEVARRALGHLPEVLRIKYWRDRDRTAWVLDEIGKEQPITAGFVINRGRIEIARVITFRESRGGEIQMQSFTRQFQNLQLRDEMRLSSEIDGISGATLSVNAMQRMARLALALDRQVGVAPTP